jgi:hypothetical protein
MSATEVTESLAHLLAESINVWRCTDGMSVFVCGPDAIQLLADDGSILIGISRAPAGMPFRWVVETGNRKRTAASVTGVLRIVRQALAPDYQPAKLRIAPLPGSTT